MSDQQFVETLNVTITKHGSIGRNRQQHCWSVERKRVKSTAARHRHRLRNKSRYGESVADATQFARVYTLYI